MERKAMQQDLAEEIAARALAWLCEHEDLVTVFLNATGASVQDLRAALSAPDGPDAAALLAVLDFVMMQDQTVIDCARALGLHAGQIAEAQARLAGQGRMHWT
jgi:hypothetical protein